MGTTLAPAVEVRRAADRMRTRTGWLDSRHSFSFGGHYDPTNTHFGLLMVNNEDVLAPGGGFDPHPHRDMEIVTWVLEGALVHEDDAGHSGVIRPGTAQRMSAGSGIVHSERAGSGAPGEGVHLVQMWVLPDSSGGTPGYEQLDVGSALDSGELLVVASGRREHVEDRAVSLRQENAALLAARLRPAASAAVPTAPLVHLFVVRGGVELEGSGPLATGDAARITVSDGRRMVAGPDGAELLLWEMHSVLL
jgi:redox-sensitive bicupin YhaK (pirin superfamily)